MRIKNRKKEKIAVLVEQVKEPAGLVFVMHGLGGAKEQSHIQTIVKAFKDNNYIVVSFDTTNSFGASGGDYENATITNYYQDLEDVITWSKDQSWYTEPFILAGHSLGGISTALYAENYPEQIKAIAPISTVVSGELSFKTHGKEKLADWKEKGYQIKESFSGITKKLKWQHMEDRLKYNLLDKVDKLTMPVLLIAGDKDVPTPIEHQKILFEKLLGDKELHVIKGSPHTFRDKKHLDELYDIVNRWIKNKL